MKRLLIIFLVLTNGAVINAQPGYVFPQTYTALDEHLLYVEEKVSEIDKMELTTYRFSDNMLYLVDTTRVTKCGTGLSSSLFEEPKKLSTRVYVKDGEIYKIVKEDHTFHFYRGSLIRTFFNCSVTTAMGLCGGIVASAQTYVYWKGDLAVKTIQAQQVRHPCACYKTLQYGHGIAMGLYQQTENLLMLKEIKVRK